ncbi:MAG: MFS transporter, partial [Kluyvera intermedia]
PMMFADVGCVLGGYHPPLFQRWFGVNLIVTRKMVVTMGALLMIGPGLIGLFTSPYIAIALLCLGGFAHQSLSGALITLSSDVFGRNEVATANGLTGMAAWMASTMFALVVGALADTIGFSPLFAVLAIFDLLGALVIWTVLQNKQADNDESDTPHPTQQATQN